MESLEVSCFGFLAECSLEQSFWDVVKDPSGPRNDCLLILLWRSRWLTYNGRRRPDPAVTLTPSERSHPATFGHVTPPGPLEFTVPLSQELLTATQTWAGFLLLSHKWYLKSQPRGLPVALIQFRSSWVFVIGRDWLLWENCRTLGPSLAVSPSFLIQTGFTHKPLSTYLSSNNFSSYILEINPPKCLLSSN